MWIQAENGNLYNSEHLTSLELSEQGQGRWLIGGQIINNGHYVELKWFSSAGEAKSAFDGLTTALGGVFRFASAKSD